MPKIYFAKKELGSVEGASVHVRYSYGAVFQGNVDAKLTEAVTEGLDALNYTINYMKNSGSGNVNSNYRQYFEKYFLTQNYNDPAIFNTIYVVLLLTRNGFGHANTIKVFSKADNDPQRKTMGYVKGYRQFDANQKHRNPAMSDGRPIYKGDIHMSSKVIKDSSQVTNVVTFVHEATHKYANTADFGKKGYTTEFGSYCEDGLTAAEALMNADSYARFVTHFYRAEKGMRQW